MEIAVKIHRCLSNGTDPFELLDLFNHVKDKDALASINEYFLERYNTTPHELITERFKLDELYAISRTLKYIREPSAKNQKDRDKFYDQIGYAFSK